MKVRSLAEKGIEAIFYTDKKLSSKRLKTIYDAPAMLYYTGNVDLNHAKNSCHCRN